MCIVKDIVSGCVFDRSKRNRQNAEVGARWIYFKEGLTGAVET